MREDRWPWYVRARGSGFLAILSRLTDDLAKMVLDGRYFALRSYARQQSKQDVRTYRSSSSGVRTVVYRHAATMNSIKDNS